MIVRSLHEFWRLLRRHTESRMPHRIRADVQPRTKWREDLARRLSRIFLRDPARGNRRAVFGDNDYFQNDPHWRDHIPFSRILQRRQRRGARREPSDRLDRASRVAAVRVLGANGRCLAPPPGDRIRLAQRFAPTASTSASMRNMPPAVELCCSTMRTDAHPAHIIRLDAAAKPHLALLARHGSRHRRGSALRLSGSWTERSRQAGLRFDPHKLLVDPYALAVANTENYQRAAALRPGDNAAQALEVRRRRSRGL